MLIDVEVKVVVVVHLEFGGYLFCGVTEVGSGYRDLLERRLFCGVIKNWQWLP